MSFELHSRLHKLFIFEMLTSKLLEHNYQYPKLSKIFLRFVTALFSNITLP